MTVPGGGEPLGDVGEQLRGLRHDVQDVREKLEDEGVKRDRRIRLTEEALAAAHQAATDANTAADAANDGADASRSLAGWALLVGTIAVVAALVAGGFAWRFRMDATDRARALRTEAAARERERVDRTKVACLQSNVALADAVADNAEDDKANWDFVISQVAASPNQDPAALDAFTRALHAQIDRQGEHRLKKRKRDCTPEGLKRYYSTQNAPTTTTKGS